MTVININNISGIASLNAQSNSLELFDNTGASLLDLNANTATFPGSISVGGTVTYDDVTNIDSVGIVTARSGIHVTGGSVGIGTDAPMAPGKFDVLQDNSRFVVREDSNQDNHLCIDSVATDNSAFDVMRIRASEIRLQNANITNLIMTDNNRIGIGTDNPTSHLQVYRKTEFASNPIIQARSNNGSINELKFEIDGDGDAYFNGNVGINTTNPNSSLPLTIAGSYPGIQFKDNQGTADFNINADNDGFKIQTGTAGAGPIERLRISSEGIITKPYQVAFFAYCNISDHDLGNGAKFQFNTIPSSGAASLSSNHTTFNNTNVFNTSTHTFTAPVAGLYYFHVNVYFRRSGDPLTSLVPRVNNSQVTNGNNDVFFLSSGDITDGSNMSGSVILQLAANDEVTVHRRTGNTGTTRFYGPHSHFCGHLIG